MEKASAPRPTPQQVFDDDVKVKYLAKIMHIQRIGPHVNHLMFVSQLRRNGTGMVTPLPLAKRREVETGAETGKQNGTQEGFTQFRTPSSIAKRAPLQVQLACGHCTNAFSRLILFSLGGQVKPLDQSRQTHFTSTFHLATP